MHSLAPLVISDVKSVLRDYSLGQQVPEQAIIIPVSWQNLINDCLRFFSRYPVFALLCQLRGQPLNRPPDDRAFWIEIEIFGLRQLFIYRADKEPKDCSNTLQTRWNTGQPIILQALTEDFQEERVLELGDEQRNTRSLNTKIVKERFGCLVLMLGK